MLVTTVCPAPRTGPLNPHPHRAGLGPLGVLPSALWVLGSPLSCLGQDPLWDQTGVLWGPVEAMRLLLHPVHPKSRLPGEGQGTPTLHSPRDLVCGREANAPSQPQFPPYSAVEGGMVRPHRQVPAPRCPQSVESRKEQEGAEGGAAAAGYPTAFRNPPVLQPPEIGRRLLSSTGLKAPAPGTTEPGRTRAAMRAPVPGACPVPAPRDLSFPAVALRPGAPLPCRRC